MFVKEYEDETKFKLRIYDKENTDETVDPKKIE